MSQSTTLVSIPERQGKRFRIASLVQRDAERWSRIEQKKVWTNRLRQLPSWKKDCVEISPGKRTWIREIGWRSYTPLAFPDFDICEAPAPRKFDVVIANQVWEHLQFPYRAARHVYSMLNDGGWFVVGTPFLIRIHPTPGDFTRWTPDGLRQLLLEAGFPHERIEVGSWGNRSCVKASLYRWPSFGWGRSLKNEPDVPVLVWAFAQKREEIDLAQTS